jgi:hypothetical protein
MGGGEAIKVIIIERKLFLPRFFATILSNFALTEKLFATRKRGERALARSFVATAC